MTTEAYRAAINKLETIKDFVKGIDFDYNCLEEIRDAEESLKQAQKDREDEFPDHPDPGTQPADSSNVRIFRIPRAETSTCSCYEYRTR